MFPSGYIFFTFAAIFCYFNSSSACSKSNLITRQFQNILKNVNILLFFLGLTITARFLVTGFWTIIAWSILVFLVFSFRVWYYLFLLLMSENKKYKQANSQNHDIGKQILKTCFIMMFKLLFWHKYLMFLYENVSKPN